MAKENVGQVYYIEQWRGTDDSVLKSRYEKYYSEKSFMDSLGFNKNRNSVTVAYFRIKLKDK